MTTFVATWKNFYKHKSKKMINRHDYTKNKKLH